MWMMGAREFGWRVRWACLAALSLAVACAGEETEDGPADAAAGWDGGLDGGGLDLAGDGSGDAVGDALADAGDGADDASDDASDLGELPDIPPNTWPCDSPEHWPLALESSDYPVLVHYRPGQEATATEVLELVETSWRVEVDQLGFRPPLDDGGRCGPDGRFDVYLWRDIVESYVDVIGENLATEWDDRFVYLVVDAWGPYGGDVLDATIAHELNHALQAADDWWDSAIVFEMTSVFVEDLVFDDDDNYMDLLVDFQSRPDWSLDRDDGYETWYMYASALYLHFLREHYFGGDAAFVAEMWRLSRNAPGADEIPSLNEPDFEDALDELLDEAAGLSFLDTVPVFARWRWYTGARDDGRHFEEGARFPDDAAVRVSAEVTPGSGLIDLDPAPMMLGSAYVEVSSASATGFRLALEAPDEPDVAWVVQAVPGLDPGEDGDVLDLSVGGVEVAFGPDGERTLIITAMPTGPYDPDSRSDRRYPVSLRLEPL